MAESYNDNRWCCTSAAFVETLARLSGSSWKSENNRANIKCIYGRSCDTENFILFSRVRFEFRILTWCWYDGG